MVSHRNRLIRRFAARPVIGRASVEGLENRLLLSSSPVKPAGLLPSLSSALLASVRCASGTVVSVDSAATPNTITISSKTKTGTVQTTYSVDPAATITADGAAVTLDKLTAGVKVSLKLSTTDPTVATSIKAVGSEAEGKVTATNTASTPNTITLDVRGPGGTTVSKTFNVDAAAKIRLNGQTVALSAIPVGAKVEVKLSALDPTNAIGVFAYVPVKHSFGTLTAVNAGAGTITLDELQKGGTTTSVTYNVDPAAKITVDGQASTLGALTAGMKVALTFAIGNNSLVTQIVVLVQPVFGKVTAVDTTANTLTLTNRSGTSTTFNVTGTTTIKVNGKTATLADVVVGSYAVVTPSALTAANAVTVRAGTKH